MELQKDRIWYLDWLRVAAAAAVMLLHVAAGGWGATDVNGRSWQVFNGYDSVVRWCVPVFVMISGALFLGRDIPVKKLLRGNVLRLVCAYLVWSLFYAWHSGARGVEALLYNTIVGHFHTWFIPMLLGLYLCAPLLRRIVQDRAACRYFLLLAFLFTFCLPQLGVLCGYLPDVQPLLTVKNAVHYLLQTLPKMDLVGGYLGYFVLGYCLHTEPLSRRGRIWVYALGAAGFAATILLTWAVSVQAQAPVNRFYDYFTLNVLFESLAVFVFFRQWMDRPFRVPRLLVRLSGCTFGAYLVHPLIIELFEHFGLGVLSFHVVFSVPVITLCVFALSFLIAALLRAIPVVGRYLA